MDKFYRVAPFALALIFCIFSQLNEAKRDICAIISTLFLCAGWVVEAIYSNKSETHIKVYKKEDKDNG